MASSMLFPLDQIKPSEILTQYSEWIYFTLVLIFFISVAGITLRKHFDRPYVKPLIISAGLMLTVGVFRFKDSLANIFEGWGIIGTILLAIMAATIPYGLCRGFGVGASRSFFLTYILIYILSWVKFPDLYHALADHNLGMVNLGLLIVFFIAIFKVVRFSKLPSFTSTNVGGSEPIRSEIGREIGLEDNEQRAVKRQAEKMTKFEIHSVEDIAEQLAEIQSIIKTHRNNLPREERERIAHILREISKEEQVFTRNIAKLKKLFEGIDTVDLKHLQELKERMAQVQGKEREMVKAEFREEGEKLKLEKAIFDLEKKLGQYLASFNQYLVSAVDHIRSSPYPYDAKPYLEKASVVVKDIIELLKETKALEEKLVRLTKLEKRTLKKEREAA
jgi:hypothetical protein